MAVELLARLCVSQSRILPAPIANPARAAGVARADLAELAQALGDADLAGKLRVP